MRTHYCGLVTAELLTQTVSLCGWVHRRRDHGGVIFVDLRDREGLVQVVCDPDYAEMFAIAEGNRPSRRTYSPMAGCSSIAGDSGSSVESSSMKSDPMAVVSIPFANPAAT